MVRVVRLRSSWLFAVLSASISVSASAAEPTTADAAAAAVPAAAPAAPVKNGPKLLVLPYQPIFRSVEQKNVRIATDFLNKELDQKDDLLVVRGPPATEDAAAYQAVEKLMADADKAEANRQIQLAIDHRKAVLAAFDKTPTLLPSADIYAAAHHALARALFWAGRDDEGRAVLDGAARLMPDYELEPSAYSRWYRQKFAELTAKVIAEKPGELLVKSPLPGATIKIDGREMDVAPVLLTNVVPGRHVITAQIEGVPLAQAVVKVDSGKRADLTVSFSGTLGGEAVGLVTDAIAKNGLDKKAVEAATRAGKDAGAAFVVAGGLAKDDDHFKVHTFVIEVASGTVLPLDVQRFDLDMLTAESDILRVVQSVQSAVGAFSKGQPQVASINGKLKTQSIVNEVSAKPMLANLDPKTDKAAKAREKDRPRGPIKALGGTGPRIKDE